MKKIIKKITIILGISCVLIVSLYSLKYKGETHIVNKAVVSDNEQNVIDTQDDNRMKKSSQSNLLETISAICRVPRKYNTDGNLKAQQYLIKKMIEYGYEPYLQTFPIYKKLGDPLSIIYEEYDENNLLGYSKNIISKKSSEMNDKKIIVCAHYDSTENNVGVLDNASGVSTVLEIARCLQDYTLPYEIDFIFFSAEEEGCVGSNYYLENLTQKEKNNIIGVINIDMVGEKYGNELIMGTSSGRPNLLTLLMNKYLKDEVLPVTFFLGASDDYHFSQNNIPAFTLINKKDINLNTKTYGEQLKNLDVDKLSDIVDTISNFLMWLDVKCIEDQPTYLENVEIYTHPLFDYIDEFILPNFKLESTALQLIGNGSSSEVIYKFNNNMGEYYYITQVPIQYKSTHSKDKLKNKDCEDFFVQFEKDGSIYFEIINGSLNEQNKQMLKDNLEAIN